MQHQMKLHHAPFLAIQAGRKTIEMRLYDEKRQLIHIGDEILFTDTKNGDVMRVSVTNLYRYPDFAALYAVHDKVSIGYLPEEDADPRDMEAFYPAEEIARLGVVGIEIRVL